MQPPGVAEELRRGPTPWAQRPAGGSRPPGTPRSRSDDHGHVEAWSPEFAAFEEAWKNGAPPAIYVPVDRSGSSSSTPGCRRMRAMASREEISPARKRCTQRRTTKHFWFCRYRPASICRSGRVQLRMAVIVELRVALSMPETGESSQIGKSEIGGAAAKIGAALFMQRTVEESAPG